MAETLIRVRLLGTFRLRGGARYNAGETAAFPPEIAEQALAAGVAVLADASQEEEPAMAKPATKAPNGPPIHKQIKWAPRKGGRQS